MVKVVTGDISFGFPLVMGHAREIKFQQEAIQQKYPGDQITDEDGQWFVGDLALAQLPPSELLRLRGRADDGERFPSAPCKDCYWQTRSGAVGSGCCAFTSFDRTSS